MNIRMKINCNKLTEIFLNKYFLVPNVFSVSKYHAITKQNACSNQESLIHIASSLIKYILKKKKKTREREI